MQTRTREERRAYYQKYYAANREKILAANKQWKDENQDKTKLANKKLYEATREKRMAYDKTWAEANPEKIKRYYTRSNATLRAAVVTRLGGRCVRCDSESNLELDHVHNNGHAHRMAFGGKNCTQPSYYWMRDAPLDEVLHGKYAIQILCNECHRTKDKWDQKPDLFFKQAA